MYRAMHADHGPPSRVTGVGRRILYDRGAHPRRPHLNQAERAKHPEINMLHYLLTLSTCLSPEERQENRLEEFQKKKWLSKVQCKPPKKTYVAVVKFRIELINFNEQDLNKEERTFPRIPRVDN